MTIPEDIVAVQKAIQDWIVATSGLPDADVRWGQQGGGHDAGPWISLLLRAVLSDGMDWVEVVDNPTPSPGEEILHRQRGPREIVLSVQVFGAQPVGVDMSAMILSRIRGKSRLPTRDILRQAGVGILRFNTISDAAAVVNSTYFEPRGVMEVSLSVMSESFESGTFIEFVELINAGAGITTYVPTTPP